jgi:hypothetical protein
MSAVEHPYPDHFKLTTERIKIIALYLLSEHDNTRFVTNMTHKKWLCMLADMRSKNQPCYLT